MDEENCVAEAITKKVAMNVKGLLSKSKTEAGNSIYKDIKDSIMQILGPK